MSPNRASQIRVGFLAARQAWRTYPNPPFGTLASIRELRYMFSGGARYAFEREFERGLGRLLGNGFVHWEHQPKYRRRKGK